MASRKQVVIDLCDLDADEASLPDAASRSHSRSHSSSPSPSRSSSPLCLAMRQLPPRPASAAPTVGWSFFMMYVTETHFLPKHEAFVHLVGTDWDTVRRAAGIVLDYAKRYKEHIRFSDDFCADNEPFALFDALGQQEYYEGDVARTWDAAYAAIVALLGTYCVRAHWNIDVVDTANVSAVRVFDYSIKYESLIELYHDKEDREDK